MRPVRILAFGLLVALLAGCLEDTRAPAPTPLYEDAQERFANRVAGSEDTTKEFAVPEGKGRLVVLAQYTIDGSATFTLTDPAGESRHRETVSGSKTVNSTQWAQVEDPPAGVWHLTILISGSGDYTFGIYTSGTGTPAAPLYGDAKVRVANNVQGADSTSKSFDVPVGTEKLTVRAKYHVEGAATFSLRDATISKQNDAISGSKSFGEGVWYETVNPLPGSWRLQLDVSGSADYVFGVYLG